MQKVFITGGTGYIGRRLIKKLLAQGYEVTALVRKGSEQELPAGTIAIIAYPFQAASFQQYIPERAVFIQLLGVAHPSPKKTTAFKTIDLVSAKASADAALYAGVAHFIYVSVAMGESKLMKAYQDVRREGEEYCVAKGLHCTFIRPWYVLGPGHWWPLLLLPLYGIAELIPFLEEKARAKGLVTIDQMLRALVAVTGSVAIGKRVIEIAGIRSTKS